MTKRSKISAMISIFAATLLIVYGHGCGSPFESPNSSTKTVSNSSSANSNGSGSNGTGSGSGLGTPVSQEPLLSGSVCSNPQERGAVNKAVRRLSGEEIKTSLASLFGSAIVARPDVQAALSGVPSDPKVNGEISDLGTYEQLTAHINLVEKVSKAVAADQAFLARMGLSCILASGDEACFKAMANKLGLLIKRRALTSAEVANYVQAAAVGKSSAQRAEIILMRLLMAPEFLFQLLEGEQIGSIKSLSPDSFKNTAGLNPGNKLTDFGQWSTSTNLGSGAELNKTYEKLILVVSGAPNSKGQFPSFRVDWNHAMVNDRADILKTAENRRIFIFDGPFKYNTDPGAAAITSFLNGFKIGITLLAPAGDSGTVTVEGAMLIDEDDSSRVSENGRLRLSPFEVAARLSYRTTLAGPNEELMAAAILGKLQNQDSLKEHAKRMLASGDGRQMVKDFFKVWVRMKSLSRSDKISTEFLAGLDINNFENEAVAEFDRFVEYMVYDSSSNFENLFSSPAVFPGSKGLADVYGVSGTTTSTQKVFNSPTHTGILNRAAFLYSGRERPATILRGVAIRNQMLCDDLPSPPAEIVNARNDAIDTRDISTISTRELVGIQTAPAACMSCHTQINPIAFTLEAFDGFGRYRAVESIFDDSGHLTVKIPVVTAAEKLDIDTNGIDVAANDKDLSRAIAASSKAKFCFSKSILEYSSQRSAKSADACLVNDVEAQLAAGGSLLDALITSMSSEDLFYVPLRK